MARKTKEETLRTYYQLLDAAIDEFMERGVSQTTLLQIASRAGMTRGAIYWHFKNKDELLKALWEYKGEEHLKRFCAALENLTPEQGEAGLRALLEQMLITRGSDAHFGQIIKIRCTAEEFSDKDSELYAYMQEHAERIFMALYTAINTLKNACIIKSKQPSELMANCAFAMFLGLSDVVQQGGCRQNSNLDLTQQSKDIVSILLDGWF